MKKQLLNTLGLLFSLLIFSSCEKVIQLDLNKENPQLVIEAIINIDSIDQYVYLNRTVNFDTDGGGVPFSNASVQLIEGESMIMAIKDLAVSSGSACTSASLEPSYVLHALGVDDELAHTSIRFGFGRFTTEEEIDYAINLITKKVEKLRAMSPLWDMMQEGIDIKSINWKTH